MPSTVTQIRLEHQAWAQRRLVRIDRLCTFLRHAVLMAEHENDAHGWYSRHVVWAISRLVALGYEFPECDELAPAFRELHRIAA
jgi:hypothetical protein